MSLHTCAPVSELLSNISTMTQATNKVQGLSMNAIKGSIQDPPLLKFGSGSNILETSGTGFKVIQMFDEAKTKKNVTRNPKCLANLFFSLKNNLYCIFFVDMSIYNLEKKTLRAEYCVASFSSNVSGFALDPTNFRIYRSGSTRGIRIRIHNTVLQSTQYPWNDYYLLCYSILSGLLPYALTLIYLGKILLNRNRG